MKHRKTLDQQRAARRIHLPFNGSPRLAGGLPRELTSAVA
jgi:hypothetical protein